MTTLVLLHGWGAAGNIWQPQAEYFQDRATVLTPTFPAWEATWLAAYLGELPMEESVLVGWSLGGMLLLEALRARQGSPPGCLVLVGTAPVFCQRRDYPWGQLPVTVRAMRRGLKGNSRQVLEEFAAQCLAPGEGDYRSQAQAVFAPSAAAGTLAAGLDYLLTRDLRSLLPGLPADAVIVQGQEDRIVPAVQGAFLRDRLPGARLYELPGAGHLPFLTQAPAFNRILEKCLSRVS